MIPPQGGQVPGCYAARPRWVLLPLRRRGGGLAPSGGGSVRSGAGASHWAADNERQGSWLIQATPAATNLAWADTPLSGMSHIQPAPAAALSVSYASCCRFNPVTSPHTGWGARWPSRARRGERRSGRRIQSLAGTRPCTSNVFLWRQKSRYAGKGSFDVLAEAAIASRAGAPLLRGIVGRASQGFQYEQLRPRRR